MATITGLSAARMLLIEALSVVSGVVQGDNLILTRRDGTTINAGSVRGPQGIQGIPGNINVSPAGGALSGNYPNPGLSTATLRQLVPTGVWLPFGGLVGDVPDGYVAGLGQALSRTTFANLYSLYGVRYGSGDGSTTFNVPNLTNRFVRGGTPGNTGGSASKTLTIGNLPAHTHGASGAHSHDLKLSAIDGTLNFPRSGGGAGSVQVTSDKPVVSSGEHEHASVGNNEPFDILPPYIEALYIIKT